MNKETFIKNYALAVKEGYAAVFAGAGTSVGAGYVDWKTLIAPFAKEIDLDIEKETDLVKVTQYYCNSKQGRRSQINQQILNMFTSGEEKTETINLLTKLPIETYWTTNYDRLIEETLKENNRKADVKITEENLANNIYDRDAVVYKMHGDVLSPESAVITKDDYELYSETHSLFTTALKGDLISKTFLFVGFSFEDPNLDYILGRIRILLGEHTREHYCFFKGIEKSMYNDEAGVFDVVSYELDLVRQELKINDLKRYGIETVLLDSYDEIPEILKIIEKHYLRDSIFISGSIHQPEMEWNNNSIHEFCYDLSGELVKNNKKVLSGFGLGVGSNVINGALDVIYKSKYKNMNEYLLIHPFPQLTYGHADLKSRWTDYRNNIIKDSGICIFIFGNKLENDTVVIADGMLEEFEIAKKLGKLIIPVGATAGAAKKIYEEMLSEKELYPYLDNYWEDLNCQEHQNLIKTIMKIIRENNIR